jgi:hypothetical protein
MSHAIQTGIVRRLFLAPTFSQGFSKPLGDLRLDTGSTIRMTHAEKDRIGTMIHDE